MSDSPFDRLAARYEEWFDSPGGRRIFAAEVQALEDLLVDMPRPWLEVGVGTGRFAEALGVDAGLDPSAAMLRIAAGRGVSTRTGSAEDLPYPDSAYGALLLVVTICFLSEPREALREAARVLRDQGRLLVGLVPRDSPWGILYSRKGKDGHPFYSEATFYTCSEIIGLAESEGFQLERARSCLFESPEADLPAYEEPHEGLVSGAGFAVMRFTFDGQKRRP